MAPTKKNINAVMVDWYAEFVARVCPALLELIGGGPGGILEQATPAQKKAILGGVAKIAEQAARIQNQIGQ